MERSDFVKLINDNEELRAKNIFKGYKGTIISYIKDTNEWIVLFMDPFNYGKYAVARVKANDLKVMLKYESHFLEEIEADPDFYTHTELKPPKFKEYDHVRLINDKPAYAKEGVKKGMEGCVIFNYAVNSKWGVIFSEKGTARDIANICVHEDDLEFID
ncbi:MAG: hypothetical protein J1F36_03530 [Clostridiales bacterium]|nr:hypothetical protein [Clostridiales bacterium]